MRKRYGSWAAAIMLAVLAVFSDITPVQAQKPPVFYPTVALRNWAGPQGRGSTWDGVQRVPGPNYPGNRYFLVPVYVYNEVDTTFNPNIGPAVGGSPQIGQHLEPIRSFSFQLYYSAQGFILDTTQGNPVVMIGPGPLDTGRAKTFFTQYSDQTVQSPLNQNPYLHVIRVAGAGEVPLWNSPATVNPNPQDTTVLLWLRFRVLPNAVQGSIIFLDSARFNDHIGDNLGGAPGFGAKYQFPYPPPSVQAVVYDYTHGNLGGNTNQSGAVGPFGQGDVEISPQPAMILQPGNQLLPLDNNLYPINLQLATDLTYDPANPQTVQRGLQLRDAIGLTELDNVNIMSDQKWLTVSLSAGGVGLQTQYVKQVNYGSLPSSQVQAIFLNIDNPAQYPPGIYYATVTFTADGAVNAPMKLYVKFIRLANPNEPQVGNGTGIRLNITNSCQPVCTSTLAFGTGAGASEALDLLYGEQIVRIADTINADTLGQCFAWFRPQNLAVDAKYQALDFVGISRDIRSPNTDTTLIYEVDFMTGGPNCYPVKVCVSPSDFPPGGRVLLAFTLNGGAQPIDLRNATPDGNGNMCVTITDHTINHFYILYTPGTIVNYLATFLQSYSWNLISLPVNPPNPDPKIIFPNAAGVPWEYSSLSSWSSVSTMEFGRGYMLRYGGFIGTDGVVAGTLSPAGVGVTSVDNVRIQEGWNSVGAASYVGNQLNIVLKPTPGSNQVPNLISDVWEFDPHTGYYTSAFLVPGRGYFIKVDASGIYSLQNIAPPAPHGMAHQTSGAGKVTESLTGQLSNLLVNDAEGNGQTLYFGHAVTSVPETHFEMPAQFQSFDARFASNSGLMSYNHSSYAVNIHTSSYPVTMKFTNVNGMVDVRDAKGTVLGTVNGSGFVTISDPTVKQVTIAEKQSDAPTQSGLSYRLDQNTPNPFAPVTTIKFATAQEAPVSLVVYNEMGEAVQTLVSQVLSAGEHQAVFDASNLPAGAYYYTLKAGSFVQTQRMTVEK